MLAYWKGKLLLIHELPGSHGFQRDLIGNSHSQSNCLINKILQDLSTNLVKRNKYLVTLLFLYSKSLQ